MANFKGCSFHKQYLHMCAHIACEQNVVLSAPNGHANRDINRSLNASPRSHGVSFSYMVAVQCFMNPPTALLSPGGGVKAKMREG